MSWCCDIWMLTSLSLLLQGAQQISVALSMYGEIHQRLVAKEKECLDARDEKKVIKHKYDQAFFDLQAAVRQKRELEKDYDNLQAEHDLLKKSFKTLQKEKEDFQKQMKAFDLLKTEHKGIQEELDRIRKDYANQKEGEYQRLQAEKEELKEKLALSSASIETLKVEREKQTEILLAEKKDLEGKLANSHASMEALKMEHEAEKRLLVDNTVRDYRQSWECFEAKGAYGSGFLKVGFYMARRHLERVKKEKFPELLYTDEIENDGFADWKQLGYAPDDDDLTTHLHSYLRDDLKNLSGPWRFFGEHGLPSSGSAVSIPESELPSSEPTIDDRIPALDEVFRDSAEGLMNLDGFPSVPSDLELTSLDDVIPPSEDFFEGI